MKNKTHLAVIVIIAALTTATWAADQSVIEDIAEQTEAGKTAPAEVPAKSNTFTDAELKAYENKIVDRTEAFYNNHMTHFFSISNVALTLLGLITAILLVFAPLLKWRYEKNIKKQLAEQAAEFQGKVKQAHDAIEIQGTKMQQQLNSITGDVTRHINALTKHGKEMQQQFDGLSRRIYKEQGTRQVATGNLESKEGNGNMAFIFYLHAISNFLAAKELDLAYQWCGIALATAKNSLDNKIPFFEFLIATIDAALDSIDLSLTEAEQVSRFAPKLSELRDVVEMLKKQVVPDDQSDTPSAAEPPADPPK